MAIAKTDIVEMFDKNERIRTANHRGTVLCTTMEEKRFSVPKDPNDVLFVMPVQYGASILEIMIKSVGGEFGYADIGIYGIDSGGNYGSHTLIRRDALGNTRTIPNNTIRDALSPSYWGKTIYQQLCGEDGLPIQSFKPFSKDQYGMLAFTGNNTNTGEANSSITMRIQYIESAGSDATMLEKSISRSRR